MQLLVIRHGRTRSNAEGRYQGSIDTDLDDVGIAQAHALDSVLPRDLDAIVSSPMRRARRTAEIVAAARGLPLAFADAFRERSVGVFEGLTQAEAREQHPELWRRHATRRWDSAPPGGESIRTVFERVADGLADLRRTHADRRTVLVAHGFVSRVIRATCLDRVDDFYAWTLDNAAMLDVDVPAEPHARVARLGAALGP